ncbi:MAG TPA: histidine phosphatase family protein [Terriglobales bacterium]|jgi:broad specificity phosphatase PhoE|nr:histidine phosphatase family protein [Terriglobales bacterium]
MKTIILIRHAETAMAGRFCGHSDPELNATGEMQLARIIEQVLPLGIDRIVSSDLRRASRTAQVIGQRIGVDPEFRQRLREIHFGLWEGMSWNEITACCPREAQAWIAEFPSDAPQGEPYAELCVRVEMEFDYLLNTSADGVVAVVTHRGPMRYALTKFFGRSEQEAFDQTAAYGAVIVVAGAPSRRRPGHEA